MSANDFTHLPTKAVSNHCISESLTRDKTKLKSINLRVLPHGKNEKPTGLTPTLSLDSRKVARLLQMKA
jgi:hypothetical protein